MSHFFLATNFKVMHAVLRTLHPIAYGVLAKEVLARPVPDNTRERMAESRWQWERFRELVELEREQPIGPSLPRLVGPMGKVGEDGLWRKQSLPPETPKAQPAELLPVGSRVVTNALKLTGTVVAHVPHKKDGMGHMVRWDKRGIETYVRPGGLIPFIEATTR